MPAIEQTDDHATVQHAQIHHYQRLCGGSLCVECTRRPNRGSLGRSPPLWADWLKAIRRANDLTEAAPFILRLPAMRTNS